MRLCLNMIVKNEAHVIERCLRSVRGLIDSWAIVDTGSTDGTQALIRRLLGDLPGELIERPWVDFAHNRNQALDLAHQYGDYALLMDADDELVIVTAPQKSALSAAAYSIEFVHGDTRFSRPWLVRLGLTWRWRGVLHEGLYATPELTVEHLDGVRMIERREGARSLRPQAEKYASDASVLKRALEQEPDNTRYAFYLAQSLRDAGRFAEARTAYLQRVAMGGWDEEIYYSKLQVAALLEREHAADTEIVAALLDAHQFRPSRAEAMCSLARYYRESNRYALGIVAAQAAAALARPNDLLFVDESVYAWRARDEYAIAAYWCNQRELSARLCRELLDDARLPADQRERVRKNLAFATAGTEDASSSAGQEKTVIVAEVEHDPAVPLRVAFAACPLCAAPLQQCQLHKEAGCTHHALYQPALPPTMTWLKCETCDHVFTAGHWSDAGERIVFSKAHAYQVPAAGETEALRNLWSPTVHRVVAVLRERRSGSAILGADDTSRPLWLDVGFGSGGLVMVAQEFGFFALGVDVREQAVTELCALGYHAVHSHFEQLELGEKLAVLSMADVLEHLPDPPAALRAAHDLLDDDGLLYLSCPNSDTATWRQWEASNTNPYWGELEHYHNFSRSRMVSLLRTSGFELIDYFVSARYYSGMELIARKLSR